MSNRLGAAGACLPAIMLAVALALSVPATVSAADEEGCLGCHGLEGFAVRRAGQTRALALSTESFAASAHGVLGCRDCHADISSIPHPEAAQEVSCGQSCHARRGGEGKEYSHEALYWEFAASVHGSGKTKKVSCLTCHAAPVLAADTERRDKMQEVRQCAACHLASQRVKAWFEDAHYLALARGNQRAPSCPDCHTDHRVWPPGAKESSVNEARLASTCSRGAVASSPGRGCHVGLGETAVRGAGMSPLPLGRRGSGALAGTFNALYGLMLLGLLVRAGLGCLKRR